MNLKPYYDAAVAADAKVTEVAGRIDALFTEGKTEDALALRPELEQAKDEAKKANDLYLSMRDVENGPRVAANFVPASSVPAEAADEPKKLARSAFEALTPAERMKFVKDGGEVKED